jgi:hypothetical protein
LDEAIDNGSRIVDGPVRKLYDLFCGKLLEMSGSIVVQATTFETRFTHPGGMYVSVSPYRELFMVSVGIETPCQIRITDESGFLRALDMAIECCLSSLARAGADRG